MRRRRIHAIGVAVATAVVIGTTSVPASAATQQPVKTSTAVDEYNPTAAPGVFAWTQNLAGNPNQLNVYLQPDGGPRVRVNAPNTIGFAGGFDEDGSTLAYQQVSASGNSSIKLYDVATGTRSNPPAGVNTGAWEWNPSISGDYLLFGRINRAPNPDVWQVILMQLSTGQTKVLGSVAHNRAYVPPGQVNGNFVVWARYAPATNAHVYRYQIDTETEMRLPRTTTHNYDPGVAPDGTVYHMRSNDDCGLNVQVVRYPEGGPVEVLASLAPNRDIGDSQVYRNIGMGQDHFYYSRFVCSPDQNVDIYQVVVDVPDGPTGRGTDRARHRERRWVRHARPPLARRWPLGAARTGSTMTPGSSPGA